MPRVVKKTTVISLQCVCSVPSIYNAHQLESKRRGELLIVIEEDQVSRTVNLTFIDLSESIVIVAVIFLLHKYALVCDVSCVMYR